MDKFENKGLEYNKQCFECTGYDGYTSPETEDDRKEDIINRSNSCSWWLCGGDGCDKHFNTNKENVSDGYHTFKELYEFRKLYNAGLFNEWHDEGFYNVHKSIRHYDGELCFGGGWFIVMAELPTGQISNHYEMKDWDLFTCEETVKAKIEFDGHTAKDVVERLTKWLKKDY